jgi:hypothetical protein
LFLACMATFDCFLVYLTLHLICIRHVASNGSPGSSVSIVTMLPVGRPGFDSWEGRDFFFFRYRVQTSPRGTVVLSAGVKQPWHKSDHSPPSSAEVKNAWS